MTKLKSNDFLDAWKKGIKLYPDFFEWNSNINNSVSINELKPINYETWCIKYQYLSAGSKAFLSAMASFYDAKYWDGLHIKDYGALSCWNMSDISRTLDNQHREIISQLFLNH